MKLDYINNKIKKHEIIERINIKYVESEILDKAKGLEEIKTKLRKVETTMIKKGFGRKFINKKY